MRLIICIAGGIAASLFVTLLSSLKKKKRKEKEDNTDKISLKEHFFTGLIQEIIISIFS